jgi:predicted PurR-regulated permease PerM
MPDAQVEEAMTRSPQPPEPAFTRKVLVTAGIVILVLFVWKIAPVLMLAFGGVVIAAAIRAGAVPLARRLNLPEKAAVSIVTVLAVVVLLGGAFLFGQRIAEEAQAMWTAIKESWAKFEVFVSRFPIGQTAMESLRLGTDADALAKVAKGTVTVFGAFADVLLVMFLAAYLALSPRTYRDGLVRLMPPPVRSQVGDALDASGVALRKWLIGQLGAMAAVGLLTGIGLWAIGVPLAVPLAILMMLLDFVPVLGPLMAALPGVLIAFSQSPQLALYAAMVYFAVQFFEGHVIMPLAQKWAVALPPALAMLGIVGFGVVFGLLGVLFAMPLLVVTVVMVQKLYVETLERQESKIAG